MDCKTRGSIHLILGPMFSGKTTELFRLIDRHMLANKSVAIVKFAYDTRYDVSKAKTHDDRKRDAIIATELMTVKDHLIRFDVIGIDEGHFFKDLVKVTVALADHGKQVYVAALNGNFQQIPFENVSKLIAMTDELKMLTAVCDGCKQMDAAFTHRIEKTTLVMIGSKDMYRAFCRTCLALAQEEKENSDPTIYEGVLQS